MTPPSGVAERITFASADAFPGTPEDFRRFAQLSEKLRLLRLPQYYGVTIMRAKKLPFGVADDVRDDFKGPERREFRRQFARHLRVSVASLDKWEIHHILPLCLGGTNDFGNLDLLPHSVHQKLHRILLDPQISLAQEGVAQDFVIPIRYGRPRIKPVRPIARVNRELVGSLGDPQAHNGRVLV